MGLTPGRCVWEYLSRAVILKLGEDPKNCPILNRGVVELETMIRIPSTVGRALSTDRYPGLHVHVSLPAPRIHLQHNQHRHFPSGH